MKKSNDEAKFTKNQIIKSKRFEKYADFLNGNLKNDTMYSISEIKEFLKKYYREVV